MKKITKDTVLKQGDKIYQAIEVVVGILWTDGEQIIATFNHELKGVPKIELEDDHCEIKYLLYKSQPDKCHKWIEGVGDCKESECDFCRIQRCIDKLESNPAKYTEEDMREAFQAGQQWSHDMEHNPETDPCNFNQLLQSINTIKVIEVDEKFKILHCV